MCDECGQIERQIAHYRALASRITDKQTLDGIGLLIAKLESNKLALHREILIRCQD